MMRATALEPSRHPIHVGKIGCGQNHNRGRANLNRERGDLNAHHRSRTHEILVHALFPNRVEQRNGRGQTIVLPRLSAARTARHNYGFNSYGS